MTIVELFDDRPINNIVGTLAFDPDKVVYVGGYSKKQFEAKKLPILMKYFNKKGITNLKLNMFRCGVTASRISWINLKQFT